MAGFADDVPSPPDADAFQEWAWRQPEKCESIDGKLFMVGGASRLLGLIAGNIIGILWNAPPCQALWALSEQSRCLRTVAISGSVNTTAGMPSGSNDGRRTR